MGNGDLKDSRPVLGITMGDPSGNGPEISVKALLDPSVYERCRPVIVGDAVCMEAAVKLIQGAEKLSVHRITDVKDALFQYGVIDVYDMGIIDMDRRLYKKDREALAQTMSSASAAAVIRLNSLLFITFLPILFLLRICTKR